MVGEELGNYRVIAPLGKGGMASVYVGEHKVLGHKVAIKILHPKHLANESIERRFFNEAKAIASIRHPSVVELFDFGRADDGRAYIVMELLEGESLRARIRSGIMDQAASATYARQVAAGLAKAHERGIIHRDLKPDNVFLVRDPEVALGERAKVLDFGIAKQTDFGGPVSEHTATGILVGTPAYMSPEQCRGTGTIDARSDIYSLGVVLYRMVTNQLPFEAAGTGELIGKHLYVEPNSAQELNPLISNDMDAVIQRCLAKDPAERFQSMDEVAAALKSVRRAIAAADEQATPSPLPAALAAKPQQSFAAPNPPMASRSKRPVGQARAGIPPEDVATEIQATPSPIHVSQAVVPPAMTPGVGVPGLADAASPTTLRHATGEASRDDYALTTPNRRVAAIAVGVIAVVAAIAFVVTAGDDTEPDGQAASPGAEISDDRADHPPEPTPEDPKAAADEPAGSDDAVGGAAPEDTAAAEARAAAEAAAEAEAEAAAVAEAKAVADAAAAEAKAAEEKHAAEARAQAEAKKKAEEKRAAEEQNRQAELAAVGKAKRAAADKAKRAAADKARRAAANRKVAADKKAAKKKAELRKSKKRSKKDDPKKKKTDKKNEVQVRF